MYGECNLHRRRRVNLLAKRGRYSHDPLCSEEDADRPSRTVQEHDGT